MQSGSVVKRAALGLNQQPASVVVLWLWTVMGTDQRVNQQNRTAPGLSQKGVTLLNENYYLLSEWRL